MFKIDIRISYLFRGHVLKYQVKLDKNRIVWNSILLHLDWVQNQEGIKTLRNDRIMLSKQLDSMKEDLASMRNQVDFINMNI